MGAGLTGYELLDFAESPRAFHAREVPLDPTPQIWLNTVTEPALVLGSTQRDLSIVDVAACAAAGVDIVRRRSGGGAVLLLPGEVIWLDVIIPAGAAGWADDVHQPMVWFGSLVATALAAVGTSADVVAHAGGLLPTDHSKLLCFDGIGPGEVLLDGRKLVGISQRRARGVARLQSCWYHRYDPAELVALLDSAARPPLDELQPVATVDEATSRAVIERLVERLVEHG